MLPKLLLNRGLGGSGQVARTLADSTQGQGSPLTSHLLGQVGCGLVDGRPGVQLANLVASVVELVVTGVEGEGLHDI